MHIISGTLEHCNYLTIKRFKSSTLKPIKTRLKILLRYISRGTMFVEDPWFSKVISVVSRNNVNPSFNLQSGDHNL